MVVNSVIKGDKNDDDDDDDDDDNNNNNTDVITDDMANPLATFNGNTICNKNKKF
jgi:hypothetical protein